MGEQYGVEASIGGQVGIATLMFDEAGRRFSRSRWYIGPSGCQVISKEAFFTGVQRNGPKRSEEASADFHRSRRSNPRIRFSSCTAASGPRSFSAARYHPAIIASSWRCTCSALTSRPP